METLFFSLPVLRCKDRDSFLSAKENHNFFVKKNFKISFYLYSLLITERFYILKTTLHSTQNIQSHTQIQCSTQKFLVPLFTKSGEKKTAITVPPLLPIKKKRCIFFTAPLLPKHKIMDHISLISARKRDAAHSSHFFAESLSRPATV